MGIHHRRSDVTVTKKRLNRTDVIVCLQKMSGKRVAEGMGGDALGELRPLDGLVQRQLDVCFMKMIPPQLFRIRPVGQRLLREKPLPYEIFTGFRIFFSS